MPQRTRILRVSTTVQKGGAGSHVLALHNGINKTVKFESHLFCPRDNSKSAFNIPYSYGAWAAKLSFIKTKFCGLDSYYDPLWMWRFKKLSAKFDIIHLHHLQGYFFDLRSLEFLNRKNVVLTLHDVWPLTGRCSVPSECERWQDHCFKCPRRDIYPSTFVDLSRFLHTKKKKFFGNLQRLKVVVLSRYAEDLLQKSYLNDKEHFIIPPGIDCSIYKPVEKQQSQIPVLGVMAAKPGDEFKGFDVVMNLIKFLAKEKTRSHRIHIVGALDKKNRRQLSQYPFVTHTPFKSNEKELSRLYNSFDVFLNFSRQETFGKTVIEAQACGIPVLARRIPAFEENVIYGDLISDDRPENILQTVDDMLAKNWARDKMHQSMKKYSVEKLIEKYTKLYNSFYNNG